MTVKRVFDGCGAIRFGSPNPKARQTVGPMEFINRTEAECDYTFSFDFPIAPGMTLKERNSRFRFSIANAIWIINNSRKFYRHKFPVIAVCPGCDTDSYLAGIEMIKHLPFSAFAVRFMAEISRDELFWSELLKKIREKITRPLFLLDCEPDPRPSAFRRKAHLRRERRARIVRSRKSRQSGLHVRAFHTRFCGWRS